MKPWQYKKRKMEERIRRDRSLPATALDYTGQLHRNQVQNDCAACRAEGTPNWSGHLKHDPTAR